MGKKRVRGEPVNPWGEVKKEFTVTITPTASANFQEMAQALGISRSELIERLGRNIDKIFDTEELRSALQGREKPGREVLSA